MPGDHFLPIFLDNRTHKLLLVPTFCVGTRKTERNKKVSTTFRLFYKDAGFPLISFHIQIPSSPYRCLSIQAETIQGMDFTPAVPDVTLDSIAISLFRTIDIVVIAQNLSHLIHKAKIGVLLYCAGTRHWT